MKREILFRGKRIDNGKWDFGFLSWNDSPRKRSYHINNNVVYTDTVGQFTGLTDKNGTKIFEGDIVKWDDCSEGEYWRFAVVELSPDIQFNCRLVSSVRGISNSARNIFRYCNFVYQDTENYLTVIGNIYDNSELLK